MNSAATNVNDLFDQAAHMFENTLKAGMTVQQESTKWVTETLRGLSSPQEWHTRNQAAMEQAFSAVQRSMDEAIQSMTDNAKSGLDLLERALQVRTNGAPSESQATMREVWETAIGSMRKNMEMMVRANARVIESWAMIAKIMSGASGK